MFANESSLMFVNESRHSKPSNKVQANENRSISGVVKKKSNLSYIKVLMYDRFDATCIDIKASCGKFYPAIQVKDCYFQPYYGI